MKADDLTNWDAADLARILASEYCDAFDLFRAFPSLLGSDNYDVLKDPDFIERNWRFIVSSFDLLDLLEWRKQKEDEEEIAELDNEQDLLLIEEEEAKYEYVEAVLEDYCVWVTEISKLLKRRDVGEICGFPPKGRHN